MPGILKQDPQTGFLEAPGYKYAFTLEKKQELLELIKDNPHYSTVLESCKIVGISIETFYDHLRTDPIFHAKVNEYKKNCAYKVENTLYECALDPKKTIDRLAYLRAFLPERYNPGANTPQNATVNISINLIDDARDHQRIVTAASTCIDESEVVDTQQVASHESLPSTNTTSTVEDTEHNDHYRK